MIHSSPEGRVTSSAPHLARGFTVSGVFLTPRLREMQDQQSRDHQLERSGPFERAGSIVLFHEDASA